MDLITPKELNDTIGDRVRRREYENLPRGIAPILSLRNFHRSDLKFRANNRRSTYSLFPRTSSHTNSIRAKNATKKGRIEVFPLGRRLPYGELPLPEGKPVFAKGYAGSIERDMQQRSMERNIHQARRTRPFAEAFLAILRAGAAQAKEKENKNAAAVKIVDVKDSEPTKASSIIKEAPSIDITGDERDDAIWVERSGVGYDQMPLIIVFVLWGLVCFIAFVMRVALFLF